MPGPHSPPSTFGTWIMFKLNLQDGVVSDRPGADGVAFDTYPIEIRNLSYLHGCNLTLDLAVDLRQSLILDPDARA